MYNFDNLYKEIPKGSISQVIIDRITDDLMKGNLKPGDKLPTELEFSEHLKVGRNAIREAMKVLAAFGVVEIRRPEGTFVAEVFNQKMLDPLFYGLIMSNASNEDMLEFKVTFINAIILSIMDKVTDEDVAILQQHCDNFRKGMQEPQPEVELVYADSQRFLQMISKMSGNACIVQFDEILLKLTKYMRLEAINNSIRWNDKTSLCDGYQSLVELLRNRDKSQIYDYTKKTLQTWKKLL